VECDTIAALIAVVASRGGKRERLAADPMDKTKIGLCVDSFFCRSRRKRSAAMCQWIERCICKSQEMQVLDVGTGSGYVASALAAWNGAKVYTVDIQDHRQTDVEFCLFDGQTLPFSSNHFDLVVLGFVLHHTAKRRRLFSECVRVAKRWVLVFEDVSENRFDKMFIAVHGFGHKLLYGLPERAQFFSLAGWIDFFKDADTTALGLRVVVLHRLSFEWFFPITRRLFVLEVLPA
jgi:SAM-dependent methyltransferase